jgi:ATP-dependent DNA helicase RecG
VRYNNYNSKQVGLSCEHWKIIQENKCETKTLELKEAGEGYPTKLYDTLSSFSNQN